MWFLVAVLAASLTQASVAADPLVPQQESVRSDFGPLDGRSGFETYPRQTSPCVSPEQRAEIQAQIETNVAALGLQTPFPEAPRSPVYFDWPLEAVGSAAQGFGVHGLANFVDQDPASPNRIRDYSCGDRTYDKHTGVDIITWPLPWRWMDADEVRVVAAAPGTIALKSDGNFDENCGSSGGNWNAVYVRHADGSVAWYGHMKRHSLTSKAVGQQVSAGEYLGVVGSSGNSAVPHLHFEVHNAENALIEPYAGPCNVKNERTWWRTQRPYYDSAVNRLMIGTAPFSRPGCPGREITNETATLAKGTVGTFTAFYRDQLSSLTSQHKILQPNGTVFRSWSQTPSGAHYSVSSWWRSWLLPATAPSGTWTYQVTFNGRVYSKTFSVN